VTLSPGARLGIGFETEALTAHRRGHAPTPPSEPEPAPAPGPTPPNRRGGDPRYEEEQQASREQPRARKIAPLRLWVVATLAKRRPRG